MSFRRAPASVPIRSLKSLTGWNVIVPIIRAARAQSAGHSYPGADALSSLCLGATCRAESSGLVIRSRPRCARSICSTCVHCNRRRARRNTERKRIASAERGSYNFVVMAPRRRTTLFCCWNRKSPLAASMTLFGVGQLGSGLLSRELTRELDRTN